MKKKKRHKYIEGYGHGLHEFRPKEFSSRTFGLVRNSGDFSDRAESQVGLSAWPKKLPDFRPDKKSLDFRPITVLRRKTDC